ncbi:MAG: rRNA maturation RNase YbeY [Candidatus Harrisonbacteria bacterium CG10_big_fil_rev_8_21_14_0_10_49_15]|uniref:rRNA maturation RNase YbeY n=1 Tax=Candidatus Harrisonbacteria bacterium CG10_big_fil_rev_8_21_14_0_10_49_15 TaxID=1974587 RepID=A0A2H0UJX6_9BACT|nr:MAG: rRNA maturation RNase YbeY [Candidatus Harrisonbacteria bacterium CG10_big_fil_rev_8_21_14_0_10_49_15]
MLSIENPARADRKTVALIRSSAEHLLAMTEDGSLVRSDGRKVLTPHLEVFLVGDSFMKKNVLSFPAPRDFPRPDLKGAISLGEIYLNPAYIAEESSDLPAGRQELGNWKLEISAKLVYMFIHGFLHLLGYDHDKKDARIEMETREKQLLRQLLSA